MFSKLKDLPSPNDCNSKSKSEGELKLVSEEDIYVDYLDNILEKTDLIKIDVEGAEIHVLEGMENIIKKYKPIILLEIALGCLKGFNKTLNDILNKIEDINYKIVWTDRQNWKNGGNIIIESK